MSKARPEPVGQVSDEVEKRYTSKWRRLYLVGGELRLGQEIYDSKSYALTQKGDNGLVGVVEMIETFELVPTDPSNLEIGQTVCLAMDKYRDDYRLDAIEDNLARLTNLKNGWKKTTYVDRLRVLRLAEVPELNGVIRCR